MLRIYFSHTSAFYGIIMSIIGMRVSEHSQEIQLIKAHWYYLSFVYWFCAITLVSGAYILSALIVTFYCTQRQKARAIHCQSVCARDMSNGPIVNEIRCNNNDYPSENIHDPYSREGLSPSELSGFYHITLNAEHSRRTVSIMETPLVSTIDFRCLKISVIQTIHYIFEIGNILSIPCRK